MLLLDAIIAPTMRTVSVQVTISSSFLKMLIEGIVCAPSSQRRREHDGFVVSTSTVPCHEHRRYHEKYLWSLAFDECYMKCGV